MTRTGLATTLAAISFLTIVLVLLAGSDLPPPPEFVWVVPAAAVAGILVWRLIPVALRLGDRAGGGAMLLTAGGVGAAFGVVTALVLILRGSGEPTIPPPGLIEAAVLITVVALVGTVAAVMLMGLAIVADRAKTRGTATLVLSLPLLLVGLPASAVIVVRVAQ